MGLWRLIGRECHFVVGNYPSIFRVIWPDAAASWNGRQPGSSAPSTTRAQRSMESWHLTKSEAIHHTLPDRFLSQSLTSLFFFFVLSVANRMTLFSDQSRAFQLGTKIPYHVTLRTMPRMLCNGNGAISHLQNEMGFVTACTIDENTFSAPFGIFYVRTEISKEIFQKMSCTNP